MTFFSYSEIWPRFSSYSEGFQGRFEFLQWFVSFCCSHFGLEIRIGLPRWLSSHTCHLGSREFLWICWSQIHPWKLTAGTRKYTLEKEETSTNCQFFGSLVYLQHDLVLNSGHFWVTSWVLSFASFWIILLCAAVDIWMARDRWLALDIAWCPSASMNAVSSKRRDGYLPKIGNGFLFQDSVETTRSGARCIFLPASFQLRQFSTFWFRGSELDRNR